MKKMDGKFKISLLFLAVILIIPVIGPHLIRHDPYAVNVRNAFLSPCKEYLFGTDNLGGACSAVFWREAGHRFIQHF